MIVIEVEETIKGPAVRLSSSIFCKMDIGNWSNSKPVVNIIVLFVSLLQES